MFINCTMMYKSIYFVLYKLLFNEYTFPLNQNFDKQWCISSSPRGRIRNRAPTYAAQYKDVGILALFIGQCTAFIVNVE